MLLYIIYICVHWVALFCSPVLAYIVNQIMIDRSWTPENWRTIETAMGLRVFPPMSWHTKENKHNIFIQLQMHFDQRRPETGHRPQADVDGVGVSLDGHREVAVLSFVDLGGRCRHEGLLGIFVVQLLWFDHPDVFIDDSGLIHWEES